MRPDAQADTERQATFFRLMEHYELALNRLARSYEADPARAEDLFQEIALGLWQAIPGFRGESSERTWLYRIAHNIAISFMASRRKRDFRELPITGGLATPGAAGRVDDAIFQEQKRQKMQTAIRQLPAADKQIILLHLEGLSYEEIEEVSGLSQSAIATRLTRIRGRLSEAVRAKELHR